MGPFPSAAAAVAACPPPTSRNAVIAVPDGTRGIDTAAALSALTPYLSNALVVVGLGLHRAMRTEELPFSPYPIAQHDPDNVVPTGSHAGVPGTISRHAQNADLVVGIGVVELHQYAGFSGGHKAVSVGLGGRKTIDALHHRDRVTAPGVRLGNLQHNPFRDTVDALGAAAGCRWVLNYAGGSWFVGDPVGAHRAAARSLDCWEDTASLHHAAVLRVPPKKAVNFYQASRAATYLGLSAAPPLHAGATLYLEADCAEGMGKGSGEEAFAAILAEGSPPWGHLLIGPAPLGGGTQRAIMLALLLQKYRLVLTGCANPAPFLHVGLEAHRASALELAPPDALVVANPFDKLPRYSGK